MNKIEMFSEKWHRFNSHLKFLITEGKVAIEYKDLKNIRINNYAKYMITSNQNTSLKINIGDSRIVCFNILACCRGNTAYFNQLGRALDHPDTSEVVMTYLLNCDISN